MFLCRKEVSCFAITFSSIFDKKGRLGIDLQLARLSGSRLGFFRDGLITAVLNGCRTYTETSELFITLSVCLIRVVCVF